jgi:hypothetical protein
MSDHGPNRFNSEKRFHPYQGNGGAGGGAGGGGGGRGRGGGSRQYSAQEKDLHHHFKSFCNLRTSMGDLYDKIHNMTRDIPAESMSEQTFHEFMDVYDEATNLMSCPQCKRFCREATGEFRVMKCGHVCHKVLNAQKL